LREAAGSSDCQIYAYVLMTNHVHLDLSSGEGCGGQVRVIASVEDPLVMGKILAHLARTVPAIAGGGGGLIRQVCNRCTKFSEAPVPCWLP
jgi:hypothetical protein